MSFASPPNSGSGDYGWRPPTTFIDVLFLVLAFFVTVVAFGEADHPTVPVELPNQVSDRPVEKSPGNQVTVTITADGKYFVGTRNYTIEALREHFQKLKELKSNSVVIMGDRESNLEATVRVMEAAYQARLENVSLATNPAPAPSKTGP